MCRPAISFSFSLLLLLALTGCARLDANLYDNDNTITQYYLDDYSGEVHFRLDSSFDIAPANISLFTLTSKDADNKSKTIYAVYIGNMADISNPTQKIIVYNHGNYLHMDYYWQRAKLLANAGGKNHFGVLMVDYQGFGLSQGDPSEAAMYNDVQAGITWLQSQGMADNGQMTLYGYSLGTAPSTELAAYARSFPAAKLILESPFASAEVMVQDSALLSLPGKYVTNTRINNADKIKAVSQPLLWLHGTQDSFLNIKTHGEVVFKNHQGSAKTAVRVVGADHGSIPQTLGFTTCMNLVANFIDS